MNLILAVLVISLALPGGQARIGDIDSGRELLQRDEHSTVTPHTETMQNMLWWGDGDEGWGDDDDDEDDWQEDGDDVDDGNVVDDGDDETLPPVPSPTLSPASLCEDPLKAIVDVLKCIEEEDATCAGDGYNRVAFRKIHNGVDTETEIGLGFWTGAFMLLDFVLDINHAIQIGPNQVSIRYVERVTTTSGTNLFLPERTDYPFSQSFDQHEHALVTVDADCKILLWDQYGDDKEQSDVEDAANAIVCVTNPFCG